MMKVYSVKEAKESILKRDNTSPYAKVKDQFENAEIVVREIINDVKNRGDKAIRDWTLKLDNVDLGKFELIDVNFEGALNSIDPELRNALEIAAKRVYRFYESQPMESWMNFDLGGQLGQIIKPIGKVGIYIPGGTTPLFSSILMTTIPAVIAGTKDLILVSPPNKDGVLSEEIIATCGIIKQFEINLRLFSIGGAQAIAAMAFGTKQVPKVDKIVGPGNIYVNLAKKEVYGAVGIDGIYGPTEALIIADETAKPSFIVADLIAQAEHDSLAIPIVITSSHELCNFIKEEYEKQILGLERASIIQKSIINNGGIVLTQSITESIEISNEFAPEHLTLMIKEPMAILDKIQNAGGIFIGESSFEVLGDYIAGPSHVMPTNGTARYSSALSVNDFIKRINYIDLTQESALFLSKNAELISRAEKLTGHARASKLRRLYYKNNYKRDLND
ncbi:MAG: histidinol dehydrogenase [Candidatus Lokiarchaeota archaeon]|jgi:histidinol dehydrogenase